MVPHGSTEYRTLQCEQAGSQFFPTHTLAVDDVLFIVAVDGEATKMMKFFIKLKFTQAKYCTLAGALDIPQITLVGSQYR